jgi:hypothetical protein
VPGEQVAHRPGARLGVHAAEPVLQPNGGRPQLVGGGAGGRRGVGGAVDLVAPLGERDAREVVEQVALVVEEHRVGRVDGGQERGLVAVAQRGGAAVQQVGDGVLPELLGGAGRWRRRRGADRLDDLREPGQERRDDRRDEHRPHPRRAEGHHADSSRCGGLHQFGTQPAMRRMAEIEPGASSGTILTGTPSVDAWTTSVLLMASAT